MGKRGRTWKMPEKTRVQTRSMTSKGKAQAEAAAKEKEKEKEERGRELRDLDDLMNDGGSKSRTEARKGKRKGMNENEENSTSDNGDSGNEESSDARAKSKSKLKSKRKEKGRNIMNENENRMNEDSDENEKSSNEHASKSKSKGKGKGKGKEKGKRKKINDNSNDNDMMNDENEKEIVRRKARKGKRKRMNENCSNEDASKSKSKSKKERKEKKERYFYEFDEIGDKCDNEDELKLFAEKEVNKWKRNENRCELNAVGCCGDKRKEHVNASHGTMDPNLQHILFEIFEMNKCGNNGKETFLKHYALFLCQYLEKSNYDKNENEKERFKNVINNNNMLIKQDMISHDINTKFLYYYSRVLLTHGRYLEAANTFYKAMLIMENLYFEKDNNGNNKKVYSNQFRFWHHEDMLSLYYLRMAKIFEKENKYDEYKKALLIFKLLFYYFEQDIKGNESFDLRYGILLLKLIECNVEKMSENDMDIENDMKLENEKYGGNAVYHLHKVSWNFDKIEKELIKNGLLSCYFDVLYENNAFSKLLNIYEIINENGNEYMTDEYMRDEMRQQYCASLIIINEKENFDSKMELDDSIMEMWYSKTMNIYKLLSFISNNNGEIDKSQVSKIESFLSFKERNLKMRMAMAMAMANENNRNGKDEIDNDMSDKSLLLSQKRKEFEFIKGLSDKDDNKDDNSNENGYSMNEMNEMNEMMNEMDCDNEAQLEWPGKLVLDNNENNENKNENENDSDIEDWFYGAMQVYSSGISMETQDRENEESINFIDTISLQNQEKIFDEMVGGRSMEEMKKDNEANNEIATKLGASFANDLEHHFQIKSLKDIESEYILNKENNINDNNDNNNNICYDLIKLIKLENGQRDIDNSLNTIRRMVSEASGNFKKMIEESPKLKCQFVTVSIENIISQMDEYYTQLYCSFADNYKKIFDQSEKIVKKYSKSLEYANNYAIKIDSLSKQFSDEIESSLTICDTIKDDKMFIIYKLICYLFSTEGFANNEKVLKSMQRDITREDQFRYLVNLIEMKNCDKYDSNEMKTMLQEAVAQFSLSLTESFYQQLADIMNQRKRKGVSLKRSVNNALPNAVSREKKKPRTESQSPNVN